MPKVKPVPDGYHTVTPYLMINGASKAIEFYKRAFGATERMRMEQPDGNVGHAELQIGDSCVMLSDEFPSMDLRGPQPGQPVSVSIHLYVEDVDAMSAKAATAGATVERPVENQFYGDRTCTLRDPFGHRWHVSTHVEDVAQDEMRRRMEAWAKTQPK